MSEELGKEMLVESAKAVALEGYKDTLQPTLKSVGNIVALPFQAIDAALSKPKLWVEETKYNFERTKQLLAEKMKTVPVENIVPPNNYVAIPALQYISYCMDNDELRDMYANLLSNSMNNVVKNDVHPGFVEIIKQLCPDEAKLLKYFSKHPVVPTITLIFANAAGSGYDIIKNFTDIGEKAGCEQYIDLNSYFDNLIRLGLLRHAEMMTSLTDKTEYNYLKQHPYIVKTAEKINLRKDEYINKKFRESYIELTDYGKTFCKICLSES